MQPVEKTSAALPRLPHEAYEKWASACIGRGPPCLASLPEPLPCSAFCTPIGTRAGKEGRLIAKERLHREGAAMSGFPPRTPPLPRVLYADWHAGNLRLCGLRLQQRTAAALAALLLGLRSLKSREHLEIFLTANGQKSLPSGLRARRRPARIVRLFFVVRYAMQGWITLPRVWCEEPQAGSGAAAPGERGEQGLRRRDAFASRPATTVTVFSGPRAILRGRGRGRGSLCRRGRRRTPPPLRRG